MTDAIEATRAAAARYGASAELPILQPAGLYFELAGEALRARAYMIQTEDEAELCLRPDMTIPALRHALAHSTWGEAFGVAYDGMAFRRPRPPHSAAAEFRQIGVERFARKADLTFTAEADLARAAIEACRAAGVSPRVRLGDVGVFAAAVGACGLSPAWTRRLKRGFATPNGLSRALAKAGEAQAKAPANPLAEALAALPTERAEAAVADMLREARLPLLGRRGVPAITARLRAQGASLPESPPAAETIDFLRRLMAIDDEARSAVDAVSVLAREHGVRDGLDAALAQADARAVAIGDASARFSPGFGRGLAYYDGFLFELETGELRAPSSLGGGGRYDGLIARVASVEGGGPADVGAWGAMGFALRPERLAEAVR